MSDIINKIQSAEKESAENVLRAEKLVREKEAKAMQEAEQIKLQARNLSKTEKQEMVQAIGRHALKQIREIEKQEKIEINKLKKIPESIKQEAIDLVLKNI